MPWKQWVNIKSTWNVEQIQCSCCLTARLCNLLLYRLHEGKLPYQQKAFTLFQLWCGNVSVRISKDDNHVKVWPQLSCHHKSTGAGCRCTAGADVWEDFSSFQIIIWPRWPSLLSQWHEKEENDFAILLKKKQKPLFSVTLSLNSYSVKVESLQHLIQSFRVHLANPCVRLPINTSEI